MSLLRWVWVLVVCLACSVAQSVGDEAEPIGDGGTPPQQAGDAGSPEAFGGEVFGAGGVGIGFGGNAGGFQSPPAGPSAPAVAITSPSGGTTLDVATTVTISGTCDSGTVAMRVKYGGVVVSTTANPVVITGTTWSFKWSPGTIRIGTQNLTAEGEKAGSGTGASSAVSVTVSGVPVRSKCNTFLHADDLTGNDGDQVTTWTARMGANGTGNAGATLEAAGWTAGSYGTKKSLRLTSANSGRVDLDSLASLFTGTNQPMYVVIVGQTIGSTGARTFFSAGSSSSSTHKWLLWQTAGAPTSLKVLKASTTTTFDNNSKMRGDTGKHCYAALDSGTQVQVYRDWEARMGECTISAATGGGANSGGASNLINRVTLGAYCSAGTYGNFWDGRVRAVWIGTSAPSQVELDRILNFVAGHYDNDQYYGDSSQAWYNDMYHGQSNTPGIAPSTGADVAVPEIRFWPRSINNWINDPVTHVDLAPQSSQLGAWYFGSIERKAALGTNHLHVFLFGKGATGINSFITEDDSDYYSAQLWDEFCRQFQAFICQMGGTPSFRMHWNQWETDAQTSPAASAYGGNFATLVAKWRARIAASLGIVITGPNPNMGAGTSTGRATIDAAFASFVSGDGGKSVMFSTSDLVTGTDLLGDDLHYNRTGHGKLGHRNAIAVVP